MQNKEWFLSTVAILHKLESELFQFVLTNQIKLPKTVSIHCLEPKSKKMKLWSYESNHDNNGFIQ